MNLSGGPTKQAIKFCNVIMNFNLKVGIENIIVVHDDLDNALGKCKVKEGGSAEYLF
jgi:peptidyl-tRNA hydrolase